MLGELGNAITKRSSRITHDKTSWMSLEWSHVGNGLDDGENEASNGMTRLTFICFYRRLSVWAKPDTSVSNITQRPETLCHLVLHDYES